MAFLAPNGFESVVGRGDTLALAINTLPRLHFFFLLVGYSDQGIRRDDTRGIRMGG